MKVNISGQEYRISWNHQTPKWDDEFGLFYESGATRCFIKKPDGSLVVEGMAHCNTMDCFKKETGRKISLTRALEAMNLTRDERREVWQEYAKFTRKTWPRFVKTSKRSD